jgi:hypothetical protein
MLKRLAGTGPAAAVFSVVALTAAFAQAPALQGFADPKGRFSISFPVTWSVTARPDAMPALVGVAPQDREGVRASVSVALQSLPRPLAPMAYAELGGRALRAVFTGYRVVQEGPATIGGQVAYYRYFTWQPNTGPALYQVQVYMTSGVLGFVVTGTTVNDPAHVRRDMPLLALIINTFRPARPPAGSTSYVVPGLPAAARAPCA